eukprot:2650358-Rhodomonas_salina.1
MLNDSFYNTPEKLDTEEWKLGPDKYSQTVRYAAAAGFQSFCYSRVHIGTKSANTYEAVLLWYVCSIYNAFLNKGKYDPSAYKGDHVPIVVKFYQTAIADFDKSEHEQAANEQPFWYQFGKKPLNELTNDERRQMFDYEKKTRSGRYNAQLVTNPPPFQRPKPELTEAEAENRKKDSEKRASNRKARQNGLNLRVLEKDSSSGSRKKG